MKNQKGITLITLVITIIIMLLLIVTITVNVGPYKAALVRNSFEEDFKSLQEGIANYYARNKELPVINKYTSTFMLDSVKNVNDGNDYYVIDIRQLDVDLHFGREFYNALARDVSNEIDDLLDVYIINEQSHTIYYPKGITINGMVVYTLYEEYSFVSDETKDIDPPSVKIVMLQSDNIYGVRSIINISDAFSGVDFTKCKYIYTRSNAEVGTDIESYTEGSITQAKTIIDTEKDDGDGWYLHVLATDKVGNKVEAISQNSIVVPERYDVVYHKNYGQDETRQVDKTLVVDACTYTPESMKEFLVWNTQANGQGTDYEPGDIIDQDLELYAKWIYNVQSKDMFNKNTNSTFTDNMKLNNNIVTIPAGYRMTLDTTKIDEGIVIEDQNKNQWVWIPVDNPEELYATLVPQVELGNTEVTTMYKSKDGIINGVERTNIGDTTGYREPDLVVTYDKQDNSTTYLDQAGFTDSNEKTAIQNFAQDLSISYYNMIESIKDYGGFYVGRYEISGSVTSPTIIKDGQVIINTNWYYLYNACTKFTTNSAVSKMIWGCLWDEICKFISENGTIEQRINILDSSLYGNYKHTIYMI